MPEVRIEEATLKHIADKVREKNKETDKYYPSEIPDAIDRIIVTEMVIEPLHITANGDYTVEEGVHGYNPISVNVPPDVKAIDITENGTYTAEDCDGYNEITVGVYPETEELNVTENGEYNPDTYGYSKVTVDVQPELEDITITDNGTYKSDKYGYGEVIVNCPLPPTDEELTLTGKCNYRFTSGGWDWFINKYGNRITTKDITNCNNILDGTTLSEIPFTINLSDCDNLMSVVSYSSLSVCPKLRGTIKWTTSTKVNSIFVNCNYLRYVDDLLTPEMIEGFSTVKPTSAYAFPSPDNIHNLNSLRSIPEWWYKFRLNPESTMYPSASYCLYYQLGYYCVSLDGITNIPVWKCQAAQTSNMFNNICKNAQRIKTITFETNPDGTPIETQWKSQTIDLSVETGYASTYGHSGITGYNSGITTDKLVRTDVTYQALKDDPDWYTNMPEYCRYNHDSAVETINSLPDTSAYLATAGGTNTIKFKGAAGSKTDGGAINTLTAEEIAVATAKGWTVTLA